MTFTSSYFMQFTAAEIVAFGIEAGVWAESARDYLVRNWAKDILASVLAGRLHRLETCGY